ncbi:hypothetical protein FRC12_021651 [Ceratobasidium sp. 428]|nr:hypothetical protein FRC12_021651 [Ceratobasidium sp. 428]
MLFDFLMVLSNFLLLGYTGIWSRRRWVYFIFEVRMLVDHSSLERSVRFRDPLKLVCPLESRYHQELNMWSRLYSMIHSAKIKIQRHCGPNVGIEVQITRTWHLWDVYKVTSRTSTVEVEWERYVGAFLAENFVSERDLLSDTPALVLTPSHVSLGDRWKIFVRNCWRVSGLMGGFLCHLLCLLLDFYVL